MVQFCHYCYRRAGSTTLNRRRVRTHRVAFSWLAADCKSVDIDDGSLRASAVRKVRRVFFLLIPAKADPYQQADNPPRFSAPQKSLLVRQIALVYDGRRGNRSSIL